MCKHEFCRQKTGGWFLQHDHHLLAVCPVPCVTIVLTGDEVVCVKEEVCLHRILQRQWDVYVCDYYNVSRKHSNDSIIYSSCIKTIDT